MINQRITKLRQLMKERGIDLYIIPTSDFHQSEYVGSYFEARHYMSGFSGSAGTLIVREDEAYLWTDGRYFIQAEKELADSCIQLMKMRTPGVPTIKEYIEKYNKKTNSKISVNDADISELSLTNSYTWELKNNNLYISEDSETNKIKEIRFFAATKDIGNDGRGFLDNAINAFSIIDNGIDKDKIKDMFDEALSEDNYKNNYYKNGITYVVDKIGMSIDISMLAETEDMAIDDMAIDDTISESGINQSSKSKSSNTSKSTSSSNVATDFEIIGGSSSVDVSSSGKSYSITCPYCGYSSNSLSTQDIQSEISKHKPGDEKNIGGSFMCASQFQGGCREVSDYYVTVKFQ